MLNTVRKLILDDLKTALLAIGGGPPTGPIGLVADAAARLPGTDEVGIGRCVAEDKKHAVELVVFDDEPDEAIDGTDIEAWAMPVAVVIHLSDDLAGRTPADVAADICGEVYAMYRGPGKDPTWGGKAVDTVAAGGNGGVALSDINTRETFALIRIRYRHTVGDPTQPR